MNLAIEQNWHGKNSGNRLGFSVGILSNSLMSNYTSTTFFSRSPHSASENTERSTVICGLAGKFRTGEKA